jgi:desampylase
MDIKIARALQDALLAAAAETPTVEICGLLLSDAGEISSIEILDNISSNLETEFEIDPSALIAAHKAARNGGPQVIGHFHSHPNGLCRPSARDSAESAGDGAVWIIIAGGRITAWRAIAPGELSAVELQITDRTR